jgi:hypothetical protein
LTTDFPQPLKYQLFKHNLIEYQTDAWLCRATTQTVRLLTYFFGDEHLKEFGQQDVPVDAATCKLMANGKRSPAGTLSQTTTGLWTTGHPLDYHTPGGGLQCCRWYTYSVTNYYLVPAKVYKRHDHPGFRSTAADVSHCHNYLDGECQLGDKYLIWTPVKETQCKYLPQSIVDGVEHGGMWVSNDSQLALTHTNGLTDENCGRQLNISDQGIPYAVLYHLSPEASYHTELPTHHTIRKRRDVTLADLHHGSSSSLKGYDKLPEGMVVNIPDDGPVSTGLLAAWTQALAYGERKMMTRAFQQTWLNSCRDMRAAAALLRTYVLSSPVGAIRTLFKDPLLYAKAGNGFVEVWKCTPIQSTRLTFLKQTTACTEEIPVDFTLSDGGSHTGYLDPVSMIIKHHGEPVSCDLQPTVPFQMDGQLQVYRRLDGTLYPAGNVSSVQVLNFHTHEDTQYAELLIPKIYTPIAAYSWDELAPTEDTNSLLATAAAQSEVVQLLTASLYYSAPVKANQHDTDALAANIVARGLKNIRHLMINPFHAWVLLTCISINLIAATWLCKKVGCFRRVHKYIVQARNLSARQKSGPPTREQAIRLRDLEDALQAAEAACQPEEMEPLQSEAANVDGDGMRHPSATSAPQEGRM